MFLERAGQQEKELWTETSATGQAQPNFHGHSYLGVLLQPTSSYLFGFLCQFFRSALFPFSLQQWSQQAGPGELRGSRAQALADPSHLYLQPSRSRCLQHTSWWPEEAQGLLVRTSELSSPPIALSPLASCESPPLPPHSYGGPFHQGTRGQSKQVGQSGCPPFVWIQTSLAHFQLRQ